MEDPGTVVGTAASTKEVGILGGRLADTVDEGTRVEMAMLEPLGGRGSWTPVSSGEPPGWRGKGGNMWAHRSVHGKDKVSVLHAVRLGSARDVRGQTGSFRCGKEVDLGAGLIGATRGGVSAETVSTRS